MSTFAFFPLHQMVARSALAKLLGHQRALYALKIRAFQRCSKQPWARFTMNQFVPSVCLAWLNLRD